MTMPQFNLISFKPVVPLSRHWQAPGAVKKKIEKKIRKKIKKIVPVPNAYICFCRLRAKSRI